MIVGRVLKCGGLYGDAEFTSRARINDFIYYKANGTGQKVLCQITNLQSTPYKGFHGKFAVLEAGSELPKVWDNLYLIHQKVNGYIDVGTTDKMEPVAFRVNPFFRHLLVAGKTGKGKTHVQIAMQEEFLKRHIPSIVVDTQGEFPHLSEFSRPPFSRAFVVEDLEFWKLLAHLKFQQTVVFNFQGLSYVDKAEKCNEILSALFEAKERDYQQAESNVDRLEIPPIIVDIDETEVYAPDRGKKCFNKDCRETIINIAKRGGKLGIGLIVSSQRLPGLHCDVRSQCNSAMVFQITDSGSRTILSQLPYMGSHDLRRVKNLPKGQCIVTGEIVSHPVLVKVREIETKRAKSLDFEGMLGLEALPETEETTDEEAELLEFQQILKKGVSFEELARKYPVRQIPIHGNCLVIPERHFTEGWTATLEIQGYKVVHCPDMPGGSVYLVRPKNHRDKTVPIEKIREMAKSLPRDTSARAYRS